MNFGEPHYEIIKYYRREVNSTWIWVARVMISESLIMASITRAKQFVIGETFRFPASKIHE